MIRDESKNLAFQLQNNFKLNNLGGNTLAPIVGFLTGGPLGTLIALKEYGGSNNKKKNTKQMHTFH